MGIRKLFKLRNKSDNKSGLPIEDEEPLFQIRMNSSIGYSTRKFYKTEDGKYIGIFYSFEYICGTCESFLMEVPEEQIKKSLQLFNYKKYVELFGEK